MTKHSGFLTWSPARRRRALTHEMRKTEAQQKPNTGAVRILVMMRCAVTEKEFAISFRGNALKAGVYFAERVMPVEPKEMDQAGDGSDGLEIPIERLPFEYVACPFCSVRPVGPVRCGRCRQLICQGRVDGDIFHCTKTCGRSGKMTGRLEHVSGRESVSARLPGPSPTPRLAAPGTKLIGRLK